ncbi:MAG: hypothetical protein WCX64_02540 [Candidatus Micrarchaeia archaeon]
MVLEQIALLGIAGVDAYLISSYLKARKQAADKAKVMSYQRVQQPVSATGIASAPSAASQGDSVILSDRLAAIKSAVGETKFADEVLPYEIGELPQDAPEGSAKLGGAPEDAGADTSEAPDAAEQEPVEEPAEDAGAPEDISERVESHDRSIQDLGEQYDALESRIAEVERALGLEKTEETAPEGQDSEEAPQDIEIPLKQAAGPQASEEEETEGEEAGEEEPEGEDAGEDEEAKEGAEEKRKAPAAGKSAAKKQAKPAARKAVARKATGKRR